MKSIKAEMDKDNTFIKEDDAKIREESKEESSEESKSLPKKKENINYEESESGSSYSLSQKHKKGEVSSDNDRTIINNRILNSPVKRNQEEETPRVNINGRRGSLEELKEGDSASVLDEDMCEDKKKN